jgi:hypothetical protein
MSRNSTQPEPNTIAFGGVATGSINAHEADTVPGSIKTNGCTPIPIAVDASIGIIIVVAVFEIHMERTAVATMNPRITRLELVPRMEITCSAIRRCRFHRCMAIAKKNPPMNRKMFRFMYASAVSFPEEIPANGNTTSGINAVAGIGMASVIHQIAINATIPSR